MKIPRMSIEEKIALLSEKEKAYILGYIDKALLENKTQKKTGESISGKTQDGDNSEDEDEAQYEHDEGRYDGEV